MKRYRILLACAGIIACIAATAYAANTLIYTEQGGSKRVYQSGSEQELQSGATFDHQSGATFVAHGLTISSSEMGAIDGITLGNSANSKAWTFNSTGKATLVSGDSLDFASGSKWLIAGTAVGASATEIDYNDITTLGSSQNSKALTVAATGEATIVSGDSLTMASGSVLTLDAIFRYDFAELVTLNASPKTVSMTGVAATDVAIATPDSLMLVTAVCGTNEVVITGTVGSGTRKVGLVVVRPK